MCCESSDVVRFDLGPLLQGQTRIAKLKSAYNSLINGPRGLGWDLLQGQTRIAKVKSACNSLIIGPRGLGWQTNL